MKRPTADSSPSQDSAKRSKLQTDTGDEESKTCNSASEADILRYESYEQFKELIQDSSFAQRIRLPENKDIIHRIVADTRNLTEEDINERKKVLEDIISKQRALLNYRTPGEKYTALHQPNVHLELIKYLVERGAQVYLTTETNRLTFAHVVAKYLTPDDFHELVTFLLEMNLGELLKLGDCNGSTPMDLAVLNMDVKESTFLMCRDAEDMRLDLNAIDDAGNNILAYAVMGGRNEEYLNLLKGLGAEPMTNSSGYTVLHHAAEYGNLAAIKLFGSVDNIIHEASGGMTPLHVALSSGRQNIHDVVQALVEQCKDAVLLHDDEGQTPMWLAKNGPIKERVEQGTVDFLQKCLDEMKCKLREGRSAKVCSCMKTSAEKIPEVGPSTTTHQVQAKATSAGESGDGSLFVVNSGAENISSYENGPIVLSNDAIHRLVSNSLDCSDVEVELKRAEIGRILETNPELISSKIGDDEKTPLLCKKVHVELLKFLISKGADVSATTKKEKTVLHVAARYLCPETYHELVLLVKGKNPEVLKAIDDEEVLAVMIAVKKIEVKTETLEVFREAGADLNAIDDDGVNLLNYAVEGGRTADFLKTLSSLGINPVRSKEGVNLIHYAAHYGTLDVMKYAIEISPLEDINSLDDYLESPLHYACKYDDTDEAMEKVHALLNDYGVKDRLKEQHMRNIVHEIVTDSSSSNEQSIEKKKQVIDKLLECDGTLLQAELGDQTPLEDSMIHVELLKYLITKGCDPRHRWGGHDEYTFLHLIEAGNFSPEEYHELLEFLIEKGYSDVLEMTDASGRRPLHEALRRIELKEDTLELLKAHGGLNDEENDGWNIILFAALGGRSLEFVKMLMDKAGLGKDDIDIRITSAAHIAAQKGNMELLKFFLELNPKLATQKNNSGETPLHLAIKNVEKEKQFQLLDILSFDFKLKNGLKLKPVEKLIRGWAEDARGKSDEEIEKGLKIMGELFPPPPPRRRVAPIKKK